MHPAGASTPVLAVIVVGFCCVGTRAGASDSGPSEPPSAGASAAVANGEILTPAQRYKKGRNVFEYGDCGTTIAVLMPLAVPGALQDEADQREVHRMLGVCYVLAERQREAEREFSSLLSIDPDHVLDPFLTPPAAVEVYERQKAAMALQLEELRRARDKARREGLVGEGGVLVERATVVRNVPLAAAFLPFGLAQVANEDPTKAVIFGAAQGAFLVANVALFWTSVGILAQPRGERLNTPEKLGIYNGLLIGHLAAGAGFGLAYGTAVVDALLNREESVETTTSRRALSSEELRTMTAPP